MIRRRLAGFLLICAFALSYTEALTAAACSMGTSTDMTMEMPMPVPANHDESDTSHPDCPLSMPGAPTNCIFSSALAPDSELPAAQFAQQVRPVSGDAVPYQLLLVRSAFHPPKA